MMKKELTRRSFLKIAGVGALAVAMSGSLTGCDVIDNLKDMDSVSAAIEGEIHDECRCGALCIRQCFGEPYGGIFAAL